MTQPLKNKIAIIFGSTGGLGGAIARKYIDNGAHIISVGRDLKKLEKLDDYAMSKDTSTTIVQIDVTDLTKLQNLAQEIKNRFGRIDILVSTIGAIGEVSPLAHYDDKVWDKIIDLNLNANWKILRSMHPLLIESQNAVALFATGDMSKTHKAYWGAYAVSKAALKEMVAIYSEESNVRINLVDPEPSYTNFRAKAFPGKTEEDLKKPSEVSEIFVTIAIRSNIISGNTISYELITSESDA